MYFIENSRIKAGIEAHGAELRSLVNKETGEEYMWCGDPAFWGRVSPVLFPVVGNYKNKTSIYEGKEYHLSQHGFARDSEFEVVEQEDDMISFKLTFDEKSKEVYPFDFELIITYELKDKLAVKWTVKNLDSREMYFSIGGHPAFNLRGTETKIHFSNSVDKDAAGAALDGKTVSGAATLTAGILDAGLLSDRTKQIELSEKGLLQPTIELFAEDALILEDCRYDSVGLSDAEGNDYLTVTFDAPVLGIWSPAGKNAPFVCIEPWYGRTDRVGFNMQLTEREYGNRLAPDEVFETAYTIAV
ncbi:MAG: aldose 1-epimerase family protein [Eubacterium sp.]|nr:aldose 1-epimerase family protein [Eubacterium sp.]